MYDDFERPDGSIDGWTLYAGGVWEIVGGELSALNDTATENAIWAGDPPLRVNGDVEVAANVRFGAPRPADPAAVGRHGGVVFCGTEPTHRYATTIDGYTIDWIDRVAGNGNSGYLIDWIERAGDHGYRLSAYDNGAQRWLGSFQDELEPGTAWRIEIDGDFIRLFVDGVLKAEVEDSTYRWGEVALWTYAGDLATYGVQNLVQFDNFSISSEEPPLGPVFHRGDPNDDGQSNITDGIFVLNYLFLGGPTPPCLEAANPNDDADINITDGIYILNYLFLGGPAPAAPGPIESTCGPDPDDSPTNLGCESYTNC